jgi:hypothetical protein
VLARGTARDFDNGQVRRLCGDDFAFGACSPAHLARAKDNLSRFAFTGLTERFDETVLLLASKLGWTSTLYVPKLVNRHRAAIVTPSDEISRRSRAEPLRRRAAASPRSCSRPRSSASRGFADALAEAAPQALRARQSGRRST